MRNSMTKLPLLAAATLLPTLALATVNGGTTPRDCYLTFQGVDSGRTQGTKPIIACEDGQACDGDGAANGQCVFKFTPCAFQPVAGCTPAAVTKYKTKKAKGTTLTLALPATGVTEATCGGESTYTVKLKKKKGKQIVTSKALTIKAKATSKADTDNNALVFECQPVGTNCPVNTAGGPTSMTFVIKDTGTDLDTGWTGESHGFPVTPNATVTLCLSNCDGGADPVCDAAGVTGPGTLNGNTLGAPLPLLTNGVPVCVVNKYRDNISGTTANMTTGEVSGSIPLLSGVYITRTDKVCPRCTGGTCDSGSNTGGACSVDANITVVQSTGPNKNYALSRACPPDGAPSNLTIDLRLTTGTDTKASSECNTSNRGPCNIAFKDLPDGCGTCNATCTGAACTSQIDDPSNPGTPICKDSKGGTSQSCCSNDTTQPCFPTNNGGLLTRNGRAAVPADNGSGSIVADEVFAGTFCIPPTGTCTVDSLTGLPGLGAVVLPVQTTWQP